MYRNIALLVREILDAVSARLPGESAKHARDLLEHDEWGESLSLICTQLYEYDIPIPATVAEDIKTAASAMKMDANVWNRLRVEG